MDQHPDMERPGLTAKDVKGLLDSRRALISSVLPRHLTPDRMTRMAVMAVQQVPDLLKCDALSLVGVFLGCSALGLEPNTPLQHAHVIPREKKRGSGNYEVTLVIGYRGYLELARRSGLVRGIHADVAMWNDEFSVEYGTTATLRHVPLLDGSDRGQPKAAYCHMSLEDGQAFAVLPWVDVLKIRDESDGYKAALAAKRNGRQWAYDKNPWVAYLLRMGRKSAIRSACSGGEVPLSLEMANAVAIDDRKVDYAALTQASAEELREGMGGFVRDDEGEVIDADTGEVSETRQLEHKPEQAMNVVNTGQGPVKQPAEGDAPTMQKARQRKAAAAEPPPPSEEDYGEQGGGDEDENLFRRGR
jgi:recombination protein RecT